VLKAVVFFAQSRAAQRQRRTIETIPGSGIAVINRILKVTVVRAS
jgi:hypothetical protein